MKILDYAHSRPNPKDVKAAGYGAVARYLYTLSPGGKGISKAEADAIIAAGLGLVLIYEQFAGRILDGAVAGTTDAKIALALARSIGFPDTRPIYFAVDFAATAAQQPLIDAYLRSAAAVIGAARVGVYGSYYVMERCFTNNTAKWFWQTRGWSNGKISVHTHFYQYLNGQTIVGALVDLNESKQADFGAWTKEATVPTQIPVVTKPVVARPVSTAEKKCIDLKIFEAGHDPEGPVTWNILWWTIFRLLEALGKA